MTFTIPFACTNPIRLLFHQVVVPWNCRFWPALLGPGNTHSIVSNSLSSPLHLHPKNSNNKIMKFKQKITQCMHYTLPINAGPIIELTFSTAWTTKVQAHHNQFSIAADHTITLKKICTRICENPKTNITKKIESTIVKQSTLHNAISPTWMVVKN